MTENNIDENELRGYYKALNFTYGRLQYNICRDLLFDEDKIRFYLDGINGVIPGILLYVHT